MFTTEKLVIEYDHLRKLINDGLLKHNKKDFIGIALLKDNIHLHNQEKWDESLRFILDNMAYNVIINLKKTFGKSMVITEEGDEIMQEYSQAKHDDLVMKDEFEHIYKQTRAFLKSFGIDVPQEDEIPSIRSLVTNYWIINETSLGSEVVFASIPEHVYSLKNKNSRYASHVYSSKNYVLVQSSDPDDTMYFLFDKSKHIIRRIDNSVFEFDSGLIINLFDSKTKI